mmetsp:Transcript_28254/g.51405  ORF Transcript_28254/g.51405 Transcript_28254/m.51405 type:complete len:90 (-) Transcript_28254:426-695(-)
MIVHLMQLPCGRCIEELREQEDCLHGYSGTSQSVSLAFTSEAGATEKSGVDDSACSTIALRLGLAAKIMALLAALIPSSVSANADSPSS